MRDERTKQILEVWKIVVGVQQHFNDISMRIRSMFVTIILALFASIGFLWDKQLNLEIGNVNIKIATILPLFGLFASTLVYFIDRYWYHRLLVGAVNHAIEIEKKYCAELPELSLSAAIGKESPYKPRGVVRLVACFVVNNEKFRRTGQLHSDAKIELFYKSVMVVLVLVSVILALCGGVTLDHPFKWRGLVDLVWT